MIYPELSQIIIDSAFKVSRELGPGLLERCYHNALYYEPRSGGLTVEYGKPFIVNYQGEVVGEYFADLVVNSKIIIELKSVRVFTGEHTAQILNYLHISGCKLGYLLNFQNSRFEFKRYVLGA
jgi:GxxExxY protein